MTVQDHLIQPQLLKCHYCLFPVKCKQSAMIPGDEVDNDCDHIIDEEIFDGKDDDDDSYIDEDVKEVNQMTHDGILHWIVKDIYQLRNFP